MSSNKNSGEIRSFSKFGGKFGSGALLSYEPVRAEVDTHCGGGCCSGCGCVVIRPPQCGSCSTGCGSSNITFKVKK
jgi:hypothetical protein